MLRTNTIAYTELLAKIESKAATVGIIGLGYVGLPLLDAFNKAGYRCLGFDVDPQKTDALNSGKSYIVHIPDDTIASWLKAGRFDATIDFDRLAEADVILICVPTPLNDSRDPDLQFIEATGIAIGRQLRQGQLVILESTTYPGTTRDILLPLLARKGLKLGQDFFLAYSPEREDPGNVTHSARSIPKVVGGMEPGSLHLAMSLYNHALAETVPVSSCEVAEACKILENTYRSVNIAMVNELKVLFQKIGIDIWEVIDAAKTKPFGFQAFYPGPGLGGHCIPIDPFYLSWLARKHEGSTKFIELAGEVNTGMPLYVVHRIAEALNEMGLPIRGSRIGILGVAYKKDIDDPRESPSFKLMEILQSRGAELTYCDPYVPLLPTMRHFRVPHLASEKLTADYLRSLDCAVIATDHSVFDWQLIVDCAPLIVDTRNATKNITTGREKIWKA